MMDHDDARARAEEIVALLLRDPAPRRYRTVQVLQAGLLREVAAGSLRELEAAEGSLAAAASVVGISRQAASELVGKASLPTTKQIRDTAAYAYGRYVAALWALALHHPRTSADLQNQAATWERRAMVSLAVIPKLAAQAERWLGDARRANLLAADAIAPELDRWGAVAAEWYRGRARQPRLTVVEQMAFAVGVAVGRRELVPHPREGEDTLPGEELPDGAE